MDSTMIFYSLFLAIVLINVSFIFKADWWRNFQIYTLKREERLAKRYRWYHTIVEKELKFAKGKYGLWLFRGLGILWLTYTIVLLVSFLGEMKS